jgi:hypothetical protein
MGAVPRPPAGLAERIKNDIPQYLQAEPERQRFSRSVAFSMRIAASILLLITSVFVTLNFLEPDVKRNAAMHVGTRLAPPARPLDRPVSQPLGQPLRQPMTKDTAAGAAAPAEEIRLEMSEELPAAKKVAPPEAPQPVSLAAAANESRARDERRDASSEGGRGNTAQSVNALEKTRKEAVSETISVTAEAPLIAESDAPRQQAAGAPVLAPPPAAAPRAKFGSIVSEAYADDLALGAKKNVFGIAVDPGVFHRIKTALENGQQPAPRTVNVEALINYFAGAPVRPPRRGVHLEVEASPAPIEADGDHAVLRFTIDTATLTAQPGASIPPIARDAHVDVDFNGDAVAAFHRVGDDDAIASESVLLYNVSVTALYDVELKPRLRSSQRVATVRLRYRAVTDGREHTIEHVIRGHDLAGDWARASRRHRLASLGAIWGESLKGTPQTIDVARRAEELVTQNPKDPLARELAHAASASGGER